MGLFTLRRFLLPLTAALALIGGPVAALLLTGPSASASTALAPTFTAASSRLSAGLAAGFTQLGSAGGLSGRVAVGSRPLAPLHARTLGPLATATRMQISVALEPRNASALSNFATEVSAPGTREYHHYLTVPEFRARFGATAATVAAVRATLASAGLTLGATASNGLSFKATGTAGQLEKVFSTSLDRIALPGGRVAFSNTSTPTLPAAVGRDVQAIVGLSTVFEPHREGLLATVHPTVSPRGTSARVTAAATSPTDSALATCAGADTEAADPDSSLPAPLSAGEYTGQSIAQAYDYDPLYGSGDEGQGVTVGIFELEPNFAADIPAFESCYGITAPVSYIPEDGGATGTASSSNEDGIETELDIENIIELAPKAAALVYQAPNTNDGLYDNYSAMVTNPEIKVISSSWGECEAEEGAGGADAESTLFEEAATQGISMAAAAGDSGAQDCQITELGTIGEGLPVSDPTVAAVDDPASQPFVTGVGGTSLNAIGSPPATRPTEVVWNNGVALAASQMGGAGGGGVSDFWDMPTYQSGAAKALNVINSESSATTCGALTGDCREVPDVSANADLYTGYVIYWDGSWTSVGGTSGAAPLWASLFADADSTSGCKLNGSLGFANPALYAVANNATTYAADFNDITSGNNDLYDTNGGDFAAGTGYDMASGLGTPVAANLIPNLCANEVPGSDISGATTVTRTATTTVTSPAATPVPATTTTSTVTAAKGSTTVKQVCRVPAKLGFVQHPAYPVRETKAVVYVNHKIVKTVTGKRIVDVVITRPRATKFSMKLVTTLSTGEVISHQLSYNGCTASKVTVKVLHQAVHGKR